ncbi:MAG: enoyl-CoA hydratase/isomerase family protein, partial [Proteobacteria bacterium]|nr:enoyl-CoA hydratase/isomerase family protein [Pseudomonadota bacterium]
WEVWEDLDRAIDMAERDEKARAVIVRGRGRSFCSGLDQDPASQVFMHDPPGAAQKTGFYRAVRRAMAIHDRLERLPQPTIAAIQGHCLGAGLELALCCDFRYCAAGTVFSLPEARFAVITDVGGLQRLPAIVGRNYAREIILRGHRFDADWALKIQLVSEVFPDEAGLEAGVMSLAEEIAALPPLAVQGAKEVLLFDERVDRSRSQAFNAARSSMILPSEDFGEVLAARLENREPEYKGA